MRELTQEMGEITGLLKKEDYEIVCYDLPDDLDVYYIKGRIYDGKDIIKYKDSSNEKSFYSIE